MAMLKIKSPLLQLVFNSIIRYSFYICLVLSLVLIFSYKNKLHFIIKSNQKISEYISRVNLPFNSAIKIFTGIPQTISDYLSLIKDNSNLIHRNKELEGYVFVNLQLMNENNNLRKMLNYADSLDYTYITTRIALVTNGVHSKTGIITSGKNSGITKGQAAITVNNLLVGRIIEVSDNSSRIMFINDFNSRIPVITLNSRIKAILAGNNNDKLSLIYVPEGAVPEDGELVITSGDGERIPYNIVIGEIKKINDTDFYVKPFLNINDIEFIKVINLSGASLE
jgi:rod shape-determining protein MreC